jgi:K+ transporter
MENNYFKVFKGGFVVMTKRIAVMTIICLCLMFTAESILHAGSKTNTLSMQKHIEKVKSRNPKEYRAMVKRANGTIEDCLDCHKDIGKKQKNPMRKHLRYPR